MPMSPAKASADLLADRRRRTPSSRSGRASVRRSCASRTIDGFAGDAVAVAVVRVGLGQDVGGMDLLDQAEPDHLRRHARRQRRARVQRAVAQVRRPSSSACAATRPCRRRASPGSPRRRSPSGLRRRARARQGPATARHRPDRGSSAPCGRRQRLRSSSRLGLRGPAAGTSRSRPALPSGGWPRPSFRWQLWQARALNSGPSPSEACVEDGDDTQSLRNSALPSLKVPSSSKVMLAEECEKASWLTRLCEVPAPPCISSNCSGLEKSVGRPW